MMKKSMLLAAVVLIASLFTFQAAAQEDVAPGATTVRVLSSSPITINAVGNATPYQSTINLSGQPAVFTRMEVRLNNVSHSYPDDLDIILVGPQGQRAMLTSDAGGAGPGISNVDLTFSQTWPLPILDQTAPASGTFKPANYASTDSSGLVDTFPAPGPGALTDATPDLSVFAGTNPNGTWSLFVVDDAAGDAGSIAGGWSIAFTIPQTFTVVNANDSGAGSLRNALAQAQEGDRIDFAPDPFAVPQTINLLTPLPSITKGIMIQGPGADLLTIRRDYNALSDFRIFTVAAGVSNGVIISDMTIAGGKLGFGLTLGGGILSQSYLTLSGVNVTGNVAAGGGGVALQDVSGGYFSRCTFSDNRAISDGASAIFFLSAAQSAATLRLINTTISGNRTNGSSAVVHRAAAPSASRLEISNSTIVDNVSQSGAGVLSLVDSNTSTTTTTLRSTIIANNSPSNLAISPGSGTSVFQTVGFNLSDNFNGQLTRLASDIVAPSPILAPLAMYGGRTPTRPPLLGSAALDTGDGFGEATDQRGAARVFGGAADIGAVELRPLVVLNTTNNTGNGSLRQIVASAASSPGFDDVVFDNSLFGTAQTITLTTGEILIGSDLNIISPGANLVTVSGNDASRVFQIGAGVTATLSGLTVTRGNGSGGDGGGIYNGGNLTLTNSLVSNNFSTFNGGGVASGYSTRLTVNKSTVSSNRLTGETLAVGGGILSRGELNLISSTVSGNVGSDLGGGIYLGAGGGLVNSSTITNNSTSSVEGGAIYTDVGATLRLRNSIVAGHSGGNIDINGGDVIQTISDGFNLIGNKGPLTQFNRAGDKTGTAAAPLNPRLGPLQNNGGGVPTHGLRFGSPALDAGDRSGLNSDQRGAPRGTRLTTTTNPSDDSDIGAVENQSAPPSRTPFDYDGDGKTDISIFRPAPGEWWINRSSTGVTAAFQFGASSDKIVPGDFTGDGKTDSAFFRPSTGTWFILRSEDGSFFSFPFGTSGDVPAPADYDGDGKTDAAVFRPSTGTWFINQSGGGGAVSVQFGSATDKPVTADYDGDGKSDVAIFRPADGSWWYLRSSDATFRVFSFGVGTDKPVPGDWTGDGKADIAIFRPSTGVWFVQRSEDNSFFSFPFGQNGDVAAPGDYDGDGKYDAAVFRPSAATWFVSRSTAGLLITQFGAGTDLPTPNAFVP